MAHPAKTSEEAIVAATVEIIEDRGMEHLSVRAVARNLGLAPNALYYHFPERKALEAAVAAEGTEQGEDLVDLSAGFGAFPGRRGLGMHHIGMPADAGIGVKIRRVRPVAARGPAAKAGDPGKQSG